MVLYSHGIQKPAHFLCGAVGLVSLTVSSFLRIGVVEVGLVGGGQGNLDERRSKIWLAGRDGQMH